jgi:hypothetical protein
VPSPDECAVAVLKNDDSLMPAYSQVAILGVIDGSLILLVNVYFSAFFQLDYP